jgi:hypothetical protein
MTKPFIPDVTIKKYRKVIKQSRKLPLFRQHEVTGTILDQVAPLNFYARFVIKTGDTAPEYVHAIIVYNTVEMLRVKRIGMGSVYPQLREQDFTGPDQVVYFIYRWWPTSWGPETHYVMMSPYNYNEVRGDGIDTLIREHYQLKWPDGERKAISYGEYQREVTA